MAKHAILIQLCWYWLLYMFFCCCWRLIIMCLGEISIYFAFGWQNRLGTCILALGVIINSWQRSVGKICVSKCKSAAPQDRRILALAVTFAVFDLNTFNNGVFEIKRIVKRNQIHANFSLPCKFSVVCDAFVTWQCKVSACLQIKKVCFPIQIDLTHSKRKPKKRHKA